MWYCVFKMPLKNSTPSLFVLDKEFLSLSKLQFINFYFIYMVINAFGYMLFLIKLTMDTEVSKTIVMSTVKST